MGLAAEGLACRRGERLLFEGVGFALPPGGLLRLVGPNGSGKSSLLRLLAGLAAPAAGVIRWGGRPIDADREAHHRRLRFLAHLDGVKPALTVAENLAFWARLLGAPAAAAEQALEGFDLARIADLPARFLSAGQRRRLALARLPLAPAALWLLDEPSTSLDSDGTERLLVAIRAHRAQGGVAVVATHDGLALDPTHELRLPAGALVACGA
jgi:heme exporter protein A